MEATVFDPGKIAVIREFLAEPGPIVITAHLRPDGDAIGSALGLQHFLRKIGHESTVIMPDAYDAFLHWMPGAREILVAETQPGEAERQVREAGLVFCLDYGAISRVGPMLGAAISASRANIVMIDHHIAPEDFADLYFHTTAASSTAQLVYSLIEALETALGPSDLALAQCLYTGIMTDTGSFRFSNTTPKVHRIAAHLLELGVDAERIQNLVYNNFTESRTRFLGHVLKEKLRVLPNFRTAYMVISLEEMEKYNIGAGDTDGFVNYCLAMQGINFGVLLKEGAGKVKLSLRSIGDFPCNEFAGEFKGGGHRNASGGISTLSLEETEKRFLNLLDKYKAQLMY